MNELSQTLENAPDNELAALRAQIAAMAAENARLKAKPAKADKLTIKVSTKGAVSIYGVGRWPATFYADTWEKLIEAGPEIKTFINENRAALSVKP